ncbi:hypothetical protein GOBAR_AA14810 [Gossypium barbadense]|uniref:Uncharacterized protein n=1 Tax=Gossypium barbadense TaxID=3634 RepID=A0A2P5XR65_GOSBA|nr:hypothetical protein GOBAR_AA14810 [Gossypium barbadense]
MVHDTFPFWLEKLPSLKVLVLRVNRFYGTISKIDTEHGFLELRILDIGSNHFSGDLSIEFLQSLKEIMHLTNEDKAKLVYIGEDYYQDSVTIVNKGIEMFYQKDMECLVRRNVESGGTLSLKKMVREVTEMLRLMWLVVAMMKVSEEWLVMEDASRELGADSVEEKWWKKSPRLEALLQIKLS